MSDDDWSESEDDRSVSEVETSVLLGIPDGEIEELLDLSDPAVSRIGGRPVFLPKHPLPPTSSHCKICANPMPLLVQMWCPFEGSAMDRVLYLWGCERSECQGNDGSVRAWRGLKFNLKYAAKLEKKKAREAEKLARKATAKAREEEEKRKRNVNPFSVSTSTNDMAFGLGTQLFGASGSLKTKNDDNQDEESSESESESEAEGEDEGDINALTKQFESVSVGSTQLSAEWSSVPMFQPVYLSTISEYVPPPPKSKIKAEDFIDEDFEGSKKGGQNWGLEGWEKSIDIDGVFDRFVKRVSNENKQCVRYDIKGCPLPFGSRDKVYDLLFPPPPPAPFTTKPGFAAPIDQRRTYNAGAVKSCPACGGPRVFECQLMPNLINVLRAQGQNVIRDINEEAKPIGAENEDERKKVIKKALDDGMQWGTCLIFCCEKDCCDNADGGWREEMVLVQWE